jgi:DNA replication initiation complex subunit (GINS family)
MLARVRRYPFLSLSLVAHAALLGVLSVVVHRVELDRQRIQRSREQPLVEAGKRLTESARLEQRVHDMARIKSQLESGAVADKDDDVQFSARFKPPEELLKEARELSRKIDEIERNARAEQLAKLLHIPKQKALEKVAKESKPEPAARAEPGKPVDAAAKIEQLEAKARDALARRGRQLEQQQDGMRVAVSESRGGGAARQGGPSGQVGGAPPGPGSLGAVSMSSVLRVIDAVIASDQRPGRGIEGNIVAGNHDDVDHALVRIPEVPAGATVKGTGRIIGPGGPYADRVYVNRWYLIGPFERKHGDAWLWPDPPEQAVVLDAAYRGKDGRLLRWEYVDSASYPLTPPQAAEEAVYYGYTELRMDREQDLTIWVGAHDDAQLWLNDKLVWRGRNVAKYWFYREVNDKNNTHGRDYNFSEGKRVVHFRPGRNKLFFKLSNGMGPLFFSLVLTK